MRVGTGRGAGRNGRRRTGTQPKRLDPRRARQRLVERIRAVGGAGGVAGDEMGVKIRKEDSGLGSTGTT